MWLVPQKYHRRNKIKEVSYQLIHRFEQIMIYKNVNCIFCNECEETALILALYIFSYTIRPFSLLWENVLIEFFPRGTVFLFYLLYFEPNLNLIRETIYGFVG